MSDAQPATPDNTISADDVTPESAVLRENIAVMVKIKNDNIDNFAQSKINITSALVEQKWHNRHQIYPYRVKEEIYGAVLCEIIAHQSGLKNEILARLEEVYQQLRNDEAQTLSRARALLENNYKTPYL
jgi:NADH pyrophosphatase NudC (nudix superfamily)